jgi:hypothetical protein
VRDRGRGIPEAGSTGNLHTFVDNSPTNAASGTYMNSRKQYGVLDNTAGRDEYTAEQD